jgi:hypothetical protein
LQEIRIAEPRDHFSREGYVQMVPPLLLPRRNERSRVEVWLKLPTGRPIAKRIQGGTPLLELPPGSRAARVESLAVGDDPETWAFSVADVRGTQFNADGELFFALRPENRRFDSALLGWSWRRSSSEEQARASEHLAELAASIVAPHLPQREKAATRYKNACATCHQHGRRVNERPGEHGVANRATDASGCYQIQNVLVSHLPLETYFPLETNLDSPFVSFDCGDQEALVDWSERRVSCADGRIPWGRLDVRAALRGADEHARAVCASRKYLYDHLDEPGRRAFHDGFEECGREFVPSDVTESRTPP